MRGVRNAVCLAAIRVGKESLLASRRSDRNSGMIPQKSWFADQHFLRIANQTLSTSKDGAGTLSGRACIWRQKCGILSLDYVWGEIVLWRVDGLARISFGSTVNRATPPSIFLRAPAQTLTPAKSTSRFRLEVSTMSF